MAHLRRRPNSVVVRRRRASDPITETESAVTCRRGAGGVSRTGSTARSITGGRCAVGRGGSSASGESATADGSVGGGNGGGSMSIGA
jgi:hypothetical protein